MMIDRVFKTTTVLAVAASLSVAGSSMAAAKDNFNPIAYAVNVTRAC